MAVASAGLYANLHLAQTHKHSSIPPLSFYRPDALPATQPTVSKHWRQNLLLNDHVKKLHLQCFDAVCWVAGRASDL